MKTAALALLLCAFPAIAAEKSDKAAEPWKGPSPKERVTVGGMVGAGVLDARVGFSVLPTAAIRLVERGFAQDLNDQVFLEAQAGPLFFSGYTAFQYHVHLRWDFNRNEDWTFFAKGGLGGILGSGRTVFYPHFGIGAIWNVFAKFGVRAELSHEFTGAGIQFPF